MRNLRKSFSLEKFLVFGELEKTISIHLNMHSKDHDNVENQQLILRVPLIAP